MHDANAAERDAALTALREALSSPTIEEKDKEELLRSFGALETLLKGGGGEEAEADEGPDPMEDGEIVADDSNFRILARDGALFMATGDHCVGAAMQHALRKAEGAGGGVEKFERGGRLFWRAPVELLAKNARSMTRYGYDRDDDDVQRAAAAAMEAQCSFDPEMKEKLARGETAYHTLGRFLEKGMEVRVGSGRGLIAGEITDTQYVNSMWEGNSFVLTLRVLTALGSPLQEATVHARVREFDGWIRVEELPVRALSEEDRGILASRGRRVSAAASPAAAYMRCSGNLVQRSWYGNKTYRAEGRVMIDANTFRRVAMDVLDGIQRSAGIEIEDGRRRRGNIEDVAAADEALSGVPDDRLHLCLPWLYGFSFSAKQWGEMHVEDIEDIAFREDAFDKLVLAPENKELIRSLVEHSDGGFSDIIESKGGGTIFLLHGPPGAGKTLTAEAVAELLRRPLYSISVGELGTDPSTLETSLRVILDVATIWNAVILLDEADIFLEARDEHSIERNAMVGVFLRLLEYHQGTLFLTTNRVRQFDGAFHSRISVALRYPAMDRAARKMVWTNLLAAAKIEGLDPEALSAHEINGRQIKTSIRMAQALARSQGTALSGDHIRRVVDLAAKFAEESE